MWLRVCVLNLRFDLIINDTIKRTIRSLKKQDLLLVKKLSTNVFNRVNHYTINYTKLDKISSKKDAAPVNTDEGNMPLCLREYKENTKEKGGVIESDKSMDVRIEITILTAKEIKKIEREKLSIYFSVHG